MPAYLLAKARGPQQHAGLLGSACSHCQHEHLASHAGGPRACAHDLLGCECDPLMYQVDDPDPCGRGTTHGQHFFSGGFPFIKSNAGGSLLRRDVLGQQRGPVASPNVVARPLDPSRQLIYPKFSDTFVEPLRPQFTAMPASDAVAGMEHDAHGDHQREGQQSGVSGAVNFMRSARLVCSSSPQVLGSD
jgi:hypothetical protein